MNGWRLATAMLLLLGLVAPAATQEESGEAPDSTEPAPRITLKWSATQEEQVYGYLVYRASRRGGPFLRINREIVHVEQPVLPEQTSSYEYVDTDVEPGVRYFYYLDVVSRTGLKQRFSGVLAKEAPAGPEPKAGR